ncbi:MAG: succinate dehydrogenase, cytochrome b556 subunit [Gammaproteobacteria bacterium]|nr:succinate dehydrogenase, cytochrome b556 subunit [Gammaproteobacteria bacterium]
MKNNNRPVYLNLFKISLPIGGIVSILHRVTGVLLVLALPWTIYLLQLSLAGEEQFLQVSQHFSGSWIKIGLLLVLAIYAQHLVSGIRHLLLDLDIGVSRINARRSAWLSFVVTLAILILAGVNWW